MSDQNAINEARAQKFKDMGIPMPMAPIDPGSMKNLKADPEKLRKLEEIRNGAKRGEFREILSKTEPKQLFTPIPTPKQRHNPNAPKSEVVVPIKSFAPAGKGDAEARMLESALFGEDPRVAAYSEPVQNESVGTSRVQRILPEETSPYDDPHGTNFLQNFKARMASKNLPKSGAGIQIATPPLRQASANAGLSEAELEKKITEIATNVSKNMIKKVISEYAKDGGGLIIESGNIRKAELVGNGTVKIGGKVFKLVPVK